MPSLAATSLRNARQRPVLTADRSDACLAPAAVTVRPSTLFAAQRTPPQPVPPAARRSASHCSQRCAGLADAAGPPAAKDEERSALAAFYAGTQPCSRLWVEGAGSRRVPSGRRGAAKAEDWGLTAADFAVPAAPPVRSTPAELAAAEIALSRAVLQAMPARRAAAASTRCSSPTRSTASRRCSSPRAVLEAIATASAPTPICAGYIPSILSSSACASSIYDACRQASSACARGAAGSSRRRRQKRKPRQVAEAARV